MSSFMAARMQGQRRDRGLHWPNGTRGNYHVPAGETHDLDALHHFDFDNIVVEAGATLRILNSLKAGFTFIGAAQHFILTGTLEERLYDHVDDSASDVSLDSVAVDYTLDENLGGDAGDGEIGDKVSGAVGENPGAGGIGGTASGSYGAGAGAGGGNADTDGAAMFIFARGGDGGAGHPEGGAGGAGGNHKNTSPFALQSNLEGGNGLHGGGGAGGSASNCNQSTDGDDGTQTEGGEGGIGCGGTNFPGGSDGGDPGQDSQGGQGPSCTDISCNGQTGGAGRALNRGENGLTTGPFNGFFAQGGGGGGAPGFNGGGLYTRGKKMFDGTSGTITTAGDNGGDGGNGGNGATSSPVGSAAGGGAGGGAGGSGGKIYIRHPGTDYYTAPTLTVVGGTEGAPGSGGNGHSGGAADGVAGNAGNAGSTDVAELDVA